MFRGLFVALMSLTYAACAIAQESAPANAHDEVPLILEGNFAQGGIIRGHTDPGAEVRFGENQLLVSEDGTFVFGLGRNHAANDNVTIILPDGRSEVRPFDVATREYVIQRVEGLPQEYVTPPEERLARIAAERATKWEARQPLSPRVGFAQDFIWPATGPISGTYGSQRFYNGEPRNPHMGIDVAAPTGTPVLAPADGVVTLADPDMYFEGGLIFIDHGHGMIDVFMHLSEVLVEVGQEVSQGDTIGLVGASGRATGPHLDWRMYVMGERVDPANLVGPMPTPEEDGAATGQGGE